MQRWCNWIEDLLANTGLLTPSKIHRAKRVGLYFRRVWLVAPSEFRQFLRSAVEFLFRMVFGWHVFVIGGIEGTIAMIERVVPAFNVSTSTWWILLWIGLSAAALWAFHKVRKDRDNARVNFGRKSANQLLARELSEMIPKSPWGEINRLKKRVNIVTGATTVKQVEDVKCRWMVFIKSVRDKLAGTEYEDEFGYKDDSDEWMRICDLDSSNILSSMEILKAECQFLSNRLYEVINTMRLSAAAITANTLPD